jgi:hypothetical protein
MPTPAEPVTPAELVEAARFLYSRITDADHAAFGAEGWALFETGAPGTGWEIERDDDAEAFPTDDAAIEHVRRRADEGRDNSRPHALALAVHMLCAAAEALFEADGGILEHVDADAERRAAAARGCEGCGAEAGEPCGPACLSTETAAALPSVVANDEARGCEGSSDEHGRTLCVDAAGRPLPTTWHTPGWLLAEGQAGAWWCADCAKEGNAPHAADLAPNGRPWGDVPFDSPWRRRPDAPALFVGAATEAPRFGCEACSFLGPCLRCIGYLRPTAVAALGIALARGNGA